jgi:nucleoid-associated protein YgaU
MGLFSFLKKAGSRVFAGADKPTIDPAEAAKIKLQKLNDLKSVVYTQGLKVEDLSMDLDDDIVTVFGQTESQSDKEKIILAIGNVEGIAAVDDRISVVLPEPEAQFYEVKSGDSLSKIAKEFYGDPMKYTVIFEANKPMLKDPNLIYPGQVLRIPNLN